MVCLVQDQVISLHENGDASVGFPGRATDNYGVLIVLRAVFNRVFSCFRSSRLEMCSLITSSYTA